MKLENNKLQVKIPFWYKPFVRRMKNFNENIPDYKEGEFGYKVYEETIFGFKMVDNRFVNKIPIKGKFKNNHNAYLKARWDAYWLDIRTKGRGTGVWYEIIDLNK